VIQDEIHWLSLNSRVRRLGRQAALLSFIVPVLSGYQMWLLYGGLQQRAGHHPDAAHLHSLMDARRAMIGLALILVALPVVVVRSVRGRQVRLGTDGRELFAKLATGELLTASGEQLMYDGSSIASGSHLFRINTAKGRPLYDAQGFEDRLASLLNRATKLSHVQMLRHRLVHREATLMGTLAVGLFCTAVLIATAPWQLLWARLLVNLGVR
jgi:hypothetical protein